MIEPHFDAWHERRRLPSVAALDARDHVHRHLVQVVAQVEDPAEDPPHHSGHLLRLHRCAPGTSRRRCSPELGEPGSQVRVGDDDEVPVLRVAPGRRLLGEAQALLEHLALDRPLEVEPLAHGAGGREQLVGRQLEHAGIISSGAMLELGLPPLRLGQRELAGADLRVQLVLDAVDRRSRAGSAPARGCAGRSGARRARG